MTNAEQDVLNAIAGELGEFVDKHDVEGIDGLLIGFGAGRMLGHGASKADVREIFERCLADLPELTCSHVGGVPS